MNGNIAKMKTSRKSEYSECLKDHTAYSQYREKKQMCKFINGSISLDLYHSKRCTSDAKRGSFSILRALQLLWSEGEASFVSLDLLYTFVQVALDP